MRMAAPDDDAHWHMQAAHAGGTLTINWGLPKAAEQALWLFCVSTCGRCEYVYGMCKGTALPHSSYCAMAAVVGGGGVGPMVAYVCCELLPDVGTTPYANNLLHQEATCLPAYLPVVRYPDAPASVSGWQKR